MSSDTRERYKFSSSPQLSVLSDEVIEKRGKEGQLYKGDLISYKVLIKDLTKEEVPYTTKNLLLNIAFYIINDIDAFQKFGTKNDIPIVKVCKEFRKSRSFIEKWRDYIIAYIVLMTNDDYENIQNYLRVVEDKQIERPQILKAVKDSQVELADEENDKVESEEGIKTTSLQEELLSEEEAIRGIVLEGGRRNAIILTSEGDFKKVKLQEPARLGEEVNGVLKKNLKDFKLYISIISLLFFLAATFGIFQYTHTVTTVMVTAKNPLVLKINTFNRVVSVDSKYEENKTIIEEANVQDRTIDLALYKLLKYMNENKVETSNGISIMVNGKAIEYGVLQKTQEYISSEKLDIRFNNAGIENKFY